MAYVGGDSSAANATTLTLTIPATVVADQFACIAWIYADAQTGTNPAGWTVHTDAVVGNARYRLLTRVIQAGDASDTVTLTNSGANRQTGLLWVDDGIGIDAATPAHITSETTVTTRTMPTATISGDRTVYPVVLSRGNATLTSWSPSVGTTRQDAYTGGSGATSGAVASIDATAGSVGGGTWTSDVADLRAVTMLIVADPVVVIPPAPAGPSFVPLPASERATIHDDTTTLSGLTDLEWLGEPASGGSDFSGAVTLAGAGTLAATGTPAVAAALGLTGSGALTLTGAPAVGGTLACTGSGALTLTGAPATIGTFTATGSGALALTGTPAPSGALSLTGSGTLALSASGISGDVALSGSGTLTLAGQPTATATIALTGAGSLTLTGVPKPSGTLARTGSGTLTLAATGLALTGTLTRTGAGTLTLTGAPAFPGVAALTGAGTLTTVGVVNLAGGIALTGVGALTLSGVALDPATTPTTRRTSVPDRGPRATLLLAPTTRRTIADAQPRTTVLTMSATRTTTIPPAPRSTEVTP